MNSVLIEIILAIIFLILSAVVFTANGLIIVRILKIPFSNSLEKFVTSTTLGMIAFTLYYYLLVVLHIKIAIFLAVFSGLVGIIWNLPDFKHLKIKSFNPIFFILIILGIFTQLAIVAPSGYNYGDGLYFWSSLGRDGVWHLSLINELKNGSFPFQNPLLNGSELINYHFFVDLMQAGVLRIFPFTVSDIYFRFTPLLVSLLIGLGSFAVVNNWTKSKSASLWAVFFTYFAGSFGYLVTFFRSGTISGETLFWVSQPPSVLGNMPQAASFVIIICLCLAFLHYSQSQKKNWLIIIAFLSFPIVEFKVYAGVIVFGALGTVALWQIIKSRSYGILICTIMAAILALGIYLPNTQNSQSFLVFEPWWYIRTMIVADGRLNWLDLELRRQTYLAHSNYKWVIAIETMSFLIFLFGNMGMRFLAFLLIIKKLRVWWRLDYFSVFFASAILVSFLFPMFFLQKGVAYNTIQFHQFFLLFMGWIAAIAVSRMMDYLRFPMVKIMVGVVIVILTIPTTFGLLWQFYSNQPLANVSNQELVGLAFLKDQSQIQDVILTAPFEKYQTNIYGSPPPISLWSDTSYVSAFSERHTFMSDEEQLTIMGYDITSLSDLRKEAFVSEKADKLNAFIKDHQVRFIYLAPNQSLKFPMSEIAGDVVYQQNGVRIIKIRT
jgi:hypothetical protein